MNAKQSDIQLENASPDKTLHGILDDIAAARVAAMQVLVFHMQLGSDERQDIPLDEFLAAVGDIRSAYDNLCSIKQKHPESVSVNLTNELTEQVDVVVGDLKALLQVLDRCYQPENEGIRSFEADADLYDLCFTRVAKGIGVLGTDMSTYCLELSEKDRADAQEKTSTIALEIGKIGRVINMVATNASIEAARAGDAGKGFTVIADEVKTLSSRVSSLSVSLTKRLQ